MRVFVLLLTIAVFFTACDNSEEETTIQQDALIGKWKLVEIRANGTVDKIACKDAVLLDFKGDGVFDVEHFASTESSDCVSQGKIDEGVWENVGNTIYKIDGANVTPKFEGGQLIMISNSEDDMASRGVFERQ